MSIASVLEELRRDYEPALQAEVVALHAALTANDIAAARRIAHRVAGTGGSYGFLEASTAARAIQDAIDANDHAAIPVALAALKQAAADIASTTKQ
jgi:HPt (histidine-containing phosphotransfer) domain-containing protein